MADFVQLILEICAQSTSAVSLERLGQIFSTDRITLTRQLVALQGLGLLEMLRCRSEGGISPAVRITPPGWRYYLDGRPRFRRDDHELETWERRFRDLLPFSSYSRLTEGPA
ncbi:MAG: hypothetical protein ABR599_05065 [Gemmatimonadota bacterium]